MSQIASILHQNEFEICFKVDDVEVFKNLLPLQSAYKQLEKRLDSSLIAFSLPHLSEICCIFSTSGKKSAYLRHLIKD